MNFLFTSVRLSQFPARPIFSIVKVLVFILTLAGCHSTKDDDTVSPQTTSGTSDFFTKCTINNYQCAGDGSMSSTLLFPNQNGSSDYQFILGMYVNNNPYQQINVVISLSRFSGKGTYTLTAANTDVNYVSYSTSTDSYQSTKVKGTLEVTDYSAKKYIQGKFTINSSQGTREIDLKNGTFKVESDF